MHLNRAEVVRAALEIIDEYGLADLTMRRLATVLKVQPGALYWHFPDKQTLLGAIADRILAPLEDMVPESQWTTQLPELAHRVRNALLAHRDGAELVSATYASRLTTNRVRERMAGALIQSGPPGADAALAASTLLYYILGHTVDEQARMQMDSAGALGDHASPLFDIPDATARFDFGVQLFISGIGARMALELRS